MKTKITYKKHTVTLSLLAATIAIFSAFSSLAQTPNFQTGMELAKNLALSETFKKGNDRGTLAITGTPKFNYTFKWNTTSPKWDTTKRAVYSYDVNNRMVEEIDQDTSAGAWKTKNKNVYFYGTSSSSPLDSFYYYSWDVPTSTYKLSLWEIFTTNTPNHTVTINLYSDYTGYGLGVINSMRFYIYLATDNQTIVAQKIMQVAGLTSPLANTDSSYFTNDVNGKQLTQESYKWIAYSNLWRKNSFTTHTYDVNNNKSSSLSQSYDTTSLAYVNTSIDSMLYDANNNEVLRSTKGWANSAWVNSSTRNTYYKNNTELDTIIHKIWNSTVYRNNTKNWYTGFGTFTTNVNEPIANESQYLVYPNPCNGKFTIELSGKHQQMNVEVYNALGEKVLQKTCALSGVERSNNVDLSNSPKGIYFVKVYDITISYTKKIVVE